MSTAPRLGHNRGMTTDEPTEVVVALIEAGRDREAARRGFGEQNLPGRPDGGDGDVMDPVTQLDQLVPMLMKLVDGLSTDDLDRPTPCAAYTVRGVLEHMIGGASTFAPMFSGGATELAVDGSADVRDQWREAVAALGTAVGSDGALDRTINSPFGEVSGDSFARYIAFDGLIHGWDLATATGQAYDPPGDVMADIDGFIRQLITPDMRDGDTFAAEADVPSSATPLERLVAFSGREIPVGGRR
jgi:uncharacterized protein (TIGR03086 family)